MKTLTSKTSRVTLCCTTSGFALVFNRRTDGWSCTTYVLDQAPTTKRGFTLTDVRGSTSVHRKLGWHVTLAAEEPCTDLVSFDPSKL